MNLQTTIYKHVLYPKYVKIYLLIEELSRNSRLAINISYKKDIVNLLADIIVIKDKYNIDCKEDYKLITKYKM